MLNEYNNSKIYKIISSKSEKVYIGSTITTINSRMSKHKSEYKLWMDNKHHYMSSFEILKYEDSNIVLIENFPCHDLNELLLREQYWVDNLDCVNQSNPHTNKKANYKNFNNSKIYKIISSNEEKVYIGSTTGTLNIRISKHKSEYKQWLNNKHHYMSSFNIVKYEDAHIVLILKIFHVIV